MAVTYQKAEKVKGTGSEGQEGERRYAEKYNKLAKAFNDRLSYGMGDPTWRLFFYAHSSMRSMVRMKPGFNSGNVWQEPTQEDAWWKVYSHIIPEPSMFTEDGYKDSTKNNSATFGWPTGNIGRFQGPNTRNPLVAYVFGTAGNTVDWFYDSEKLPPEWFRTQLVKLNLDFENVHGSNAVDIRDGAKEWTDNIGDRDIANDGTKATPVPLVDSFMFYDPKLNKTNNPLRSDLVGVSGTHSPVTLAEMWLMAKIQRGVVVPEVNVPLNQDDYKSAMTHAAAPAYMTARWYYDYYIHWRSPHGKTPPLYGPSPEVVGLCPWLDERFPPIPIYEYIFSPIDSSTHPKLRFKTACSYESERLYGVRREYDHYLLMFWDGKYTDPILGKRKKGNLKLPYKHYYEGPYTGGGRLTKREAEKDQIDSALNFYNSSFRKHFSANISKEIFSKYLVETDKGRTGLPEDKRYDNLSEATFDVPTWGFEFEKFFKKQYALAPALGAVNWKDGFVKEDEEKEHLYEPQYPFLAQLNRVSFASSIIGMGITHPVTGSLTNYSQRLAPFVQGYDIDGISPGPWGENNFSLLTSSITSGDDRYPDASGHMLSVEYFYQTKFCIAGYYAVGCGIAVANGSPTEVHLKMLQYKKEVYDRLGTCEGCSDPDPNGRRRGPNGCPSYKTECEDDGGTWTDPPDPVVHKTHRISAAVTTVPGSGFCVENYGADAGDQSVDQEEINSQPTSIDCQNAGYTWVEEGVFQKLYYFDEGEEILLADRIVEIEPESNIRLLLEPKFQDTSVKRYYRLGYNNVKLEASNSWSGVGVELAVVLRMKPDLPDAMLMLRLASSGLGSDNQQVAVKERWGGNTDDKISSAIGKGVDTKGDMLFSTYEGDGRNSEVEPDVTMAPKMIWENYNNYGIIKNLFGASNLPHKMGKQYGRTDSESYTKQRMDENIAAGGEAGEVANTDMPINANPIYDSAREMVHRHLRMVPRTHLVDYQVLIDENDHVCMKQDSPDGLTTRWAELPEIETEVECKRLDTKGDSTYTWALGRTKSILTFNRYVDMYGDPNVPSLGNLHDETLTEDSVNPNVIGPKEPGPDDVGP